MGRFPNIAASKAKTGAAKAKVYSSYAKEIYQVAKQGGTDPNGNLTLRSIIEKVMTDIMYEIPSREDVAKCIVTEGTITGSVQPTLVFASEEDSRETAS